MIYDNYPTLDISASEDVGTGKIPCPYCGQLERSDSILVRVPAGTMKYGQPIESERVQCPCFECRVFWGKIYASVPARYRSLRLSQMVPSPLAKNAPLPLQQRMIDHCKTTVWESQFFLGPVGCGKTALQYALWRCWVGRVVHRYIMESVMGCWPIWNVDANELLDQHHAYVTSRETTDDKGNTIKPKYPEVTPELIRFVANKYPLDQHFKPVLVLREIDKLNATEFKIDVLFKIIGFLHDHKGVLILDSNLTWEQFVERFGLPLARRVRVLCHLVDYHNKTIELPSEGEVADAE